MVILLDLGAIVGDQYLISAHDGTYGSAGRQFELTHRLAHYLGGVLVTVGDGLDGLGGAWRRL